MTPQELEQRQRVVQEAKSWLRTPFRHGTNRKGVGADCSTFVAEVFRAAGVFETEALPPIPDQWHLNGRKELYIDYLAQYAVEFNYLPGDPAVKPPPPGTILLVKHRWVYSHGAIVATWPYVIHCHIPAVAETEVFCNPVFGNVMKFFNPWGKR